MTSEVRIWLGIGSNVGDRWSHLRRVVDGFADIEAVSLVYRTEAVGDKHGHGEHLNAVVRLSTTMSPKAVLMRGLELEAEAGRDRSLERGPCPLDVDVLLVEGQAIDVPGLQVPHPRMYERRFVLVPLADINPELVSARQLQEAVGQVILAGSL